MQANDAEKSQLPHMTRLLRVMARLRDKEGGCPWDLEQDFASIAHYTLEEAYEVVDAIERQDMAAFRDELGDLLLQVVFHAQMADEQNLFDFESVAASIAEKMVRRHPHVFGEVQVENGADVHANWESIKAEERAGKSEDTSILADMPLALPALLRAFKLQKRAARVGFDWPDAQPIYAKISEELQEVREATTPENRAEEIGDLLFAVVNLARHYEVDAENALRAANQKFDRRIRFIETALAAEGKQMADVSLDDMEAQWQAAKHTEKAA